MTVKELRFWRSRHDLNRVLKPQNFLPVLPVIFVTSTLANADLQSSASLLLWISANLFAFLFLAILVFSISHFSTKHQSVNSASVLTLIAIGLLLGVLKSVLTEGPVLLLESRLGSSSILEMVLNPGIFVGPALVVVTALYIKGKDLYFAERDLLISQKVAALQDSSDGESFSDQILKDIVSRATEKLSELRARLREASDTKVLSKQANEIRALVELTIRPLSHKIWKSQSASYANYNTRELTRIWSNSGERRPLLFALTITPGIVSWLFVNAPGELVLISLVIILGLNVLVQWLSKQLGQLSGPMSAIRLVLTESLGVAGTWLVMASHVWDSQEQVLAVLVSLSVFLPTFSWLLGLYTAGLSMRGAVRNELEDLIGEVALRNLVEKATLRLHTRHLAQTLHSQVQNELIATALRLERGVISKIEELDQQLEEIAKSLEETVAQPEVSNDKSVNDYLAETARAWQGFISLEILQRGDLRGWSDESTVLAQAINEAISNAFKHGGADRVEIRIEGHDFLEIVVTDNGMRSPEVRPGLGFALFSQITRGNFDFSQSRTGGTLVLRVPKGT